MQITKHTVTSVVVIALFGGATTSVAAACSAAEPDRAESLDAAGEITLPTDDAANATASTNDGGSTRVYTDGLYAATGWYGNLRRRCPGRSSAR